MKLIDKSKTKQFGVLLIIIGTFVPSILYPFTSLTHTAFLMEILFASRGVSSNTRLQDLEVVLVKGDSKLQGNQARLPCKKSEAILSYNINIFVMHRLRIRNLYSYFEAAAQKGLFSV
jgi:hypothetical protein